MRKVEVLCLSACPAEDCGTTVRLVKEALAEFGIAAEVEARGVSEQEAARLGFTSSPVIRMNGMDLFIPEPAGLTDRVACWMYSKPALKKAVLRRLLLATIGGRKRD